MRMNSKAFYLKINRKEEYALKNLSIWIDVSYLMQADCFVICDDEEIKKTVCDNLLLYRDIEFIRSEQNDSIQYIVGNIANRNWINAAYAHLTSFFHAYGRYQHFWNIDADDTRFCVSINRIVEILNAVEDLAETNNYDCLSLDMWRSETYGKHWSFGVTYINGQNDWIQLCIKKCTDEKYFLMDKEGNQNIDWFFTYLKEFTEQKIETFYVENLKFIHYSNDFFEKPIGSGMYHWKNGFLTYPLAEYGFGINEIGRYEISKDIHRLDIHIQDEETAGTLAYYAREGKDLSRFYNVESLINEQVTALKYETFLNKHGYRKEDSPEIICFGAGNALEKNIKKIRKIYPLKTVCDNNPDKWGKELLEGIKCISPSELKEKEKVIVIILVYSKGCAKQIESHLQEMELEYDSMNNFLLCVE